MEHEELLEQNHPFSFPSELTKEIAQSPPAGDIEPERLRKIFLRVLRGICTDVIGWRNGYAPALKVHPGVVHTAIGLVDLTKRAAKLAGTRPVPVMIQEAVTQLVSDEADEHGPGDFIPSPLAHHIALLDFDHPGVFGIDAGNAGTEQDPISPILDAGNQQQTTNPGERAGNEVASRGVSAAPGTGIHQIIYPAADRKSVVEGKEGEHRW